MLDLTEETLAVLRAAGFFDCTPTYWRLAKEWHFEDHADRGRDLRVFNSGVAVLRGPHNGDTHYGRLLSLGAVRVDSEAELLALLTKLEWL